MAYEKFTLPNVNSSIASAVGSVGPIYSITTTVAHNSGEKIYFKAHWKWTGTPEIKRINILIRSTYSGSTTTIVSAWINPAYNEFNINWVGTASACSSNRVVNFSLLGDNNSSSGIYGGTIVVDNAVLAWGAPKVVAGDPIYKTDFDKVLQSATVGNKISNSNFTTGDKITASAWNTKWGL